VIIFYLKNHVYVVEVTRELKNLVRV